MHSSHLNGVLSVLPVRTIHARAGLSMRRNCYLFAASYRGNTAWLPALPSRLQSVADSQGRLAARGGL